MGSRGPLGPWYPGGLEMRLRVFVVGRLRQWWVVWMEMSDPLGLQGKREIHQSFSFINHLWISLVFVPCPAIFPTRFTILSFMLSPLPVCLSSFFSFTSTASQMHYIKTRKCSAVTSILLSTFNIFTLTTVEPQQSYGQCLGKPEGAPTDADFHHCWKCIEFAIDTVYTIVRDSF